MNAPLSHKHTAVALRILKGDSIRYFVRFGLGGRALTAWSLAGATLFGPWAVTEIEAAQRRLAAKGLDVAQTLVLTV